MPYRLVITKGPLKGRAFLVTKTEAKIGRDPANDIVLPDDYISRMHATIVTRGNTHTVVNSSPNGTLVNGRRVERGRLKPGDEITLGAETVLRYELEASPAVAARPQTDEAARKAAAALKARPLLLRRPKLLIGGLIYLGLLVALAVVLTMYRHRSTPPEQPLLTKDAIIRDLTRPLDRERDPIQARAALARGMDLYERREVDPANLYAAVVAFKEAEAYLGTSLTRPEHINAYNTCLDDLATRLDEFYFKAYALQQERRYNEARDYYANVLKYINDPDSAIFKDVSQRIRELQPFLERRRWGA